MKNQNDYYDYCYSLFKYLEISNENNTSSNTIEKKCTCSRIYIFNKEIEFQEDKKLYSFINSYLAKNNVFKG